MFIGYGLDPSRREAVSINTSRLVVDLNGFGDEVSVLSLGYPMSDKGSLYGYSFLDTVLRRQTIINNISNYIVEHKITHIVDVFVLPLSSLLFIVPLCTIHPNVIFIKELHNDAGHPRYFSSETIIRIIANSKWQLNKLLCSYKRVYTRNPGLAAKYHLSFLPPCVETKALVRRYSTLPLRICYLGHALKKKGIFVFPKLFQLLSAHEKKSVIFTFSLSHLGNPSKMGKMLKLAAKNTGITISILGEQSPSVFFRSQDVYLLPIQDIYGAVSTPNTVLEAMEAGCLVGVTKIDSLVGLVESGHNALQFTYPTAQSLYQLLHGLLKDRAKYHVLVRQARKDIMNKYNRSNYLQALETIYA